MTYCDYRILYTAEAELATHHRNLYCFCFIKKSVYREKSSNIYRNSLYILGLGLRLSARFLFRNSPRGIPIARRARSPALAELLLTVRVRGRGGAVLCRKVRQVRSRDRKGRDELA